MCFGLKRSEGRRRESDVRSKNNNKHATRHILTSSNEERWVGIKGDRAAEQGEKELFVPLLIGLFATLLFKKWRWNGEESECVPSL